MNEDTLAEGLGWFSIALGAAELLNPCALNDALGVRNHIRGDRVARGYGVREIAAGIGILTQKEPAARAFWMWSRVAGDLVDLATLFSVATTTSKRGFTATSIASVLGVTALDVYVASRLSERAGGARELRLVA